MSWLRLRRDVLNWKAPKRAAVGCCKKTGGFGVIFADLFKGLLKNIEIEDTYVKIRLASLNKFVGSDGCSKIGLSYKGTYACLFSSRHEKPQALEVHRISLQKGYSIPFALAFFPGVFFLPGIYTSFCCFVRPSCGQEHRWNSCLVLESDS